MSAGKTHGLRDVTPYKLYELRGKQTEIFISRQVSSAKLQRVKIKRADADKAVGLPKSNFVEFCAQMLDGAKRIGSPNYFEN